MPKLHCFIAMSFGHQDTDGIYDKHIKKAVKAAGMEPIRIDRAIYLDRIDAKIRKEIDKSDVVIADLTYARPSVYWEAGFAERQSPVVYTCRSDHFISKPKDEFGNLNIHFDLRNANIIPWSLDGGNNAFSEKLRKTLLHATRSIREQNETLEELRFDREDFARKSQYEQRKLITDASKKTLRSLGYKRLPPRSRITLTGRHYMVSQLISWENDIGLIKQTGSTFICLPFPTCFPKVDDKLIELQLNAKGGFWDFDQLVSVQQVREAPKYFAKRRCKSIRRIIILPVIGNVSQKQVAGVIPSWRKADSFLHYYNPDLSMPSDDSSPRASSSEIIFIGGIKSVIEYRDTLTQLVRNLETNPEPIINP